MYAIDLTKTIEALKKNLLENEERYMYGEISEEEFIFKRNSIEMSLWQYEFLTEDN